MKNYLFFILFIFLILFKLKAQPNPFNKEMDSVYNALISNEINVTKAQEIMGFIGKMRYPENSKKIFLEILNYSKKENNYNLNAETHYALGNYYFYNAKLDSALVEIENAEIHLKNVKHSLLEPSIKMTKGGILLRKGSIIEANSNFLESLNLLDKIDTLKLSKADRVKRKGKKLVLFNSIANFNTSTENYEEANLYFSNAITMAMDMNDKRVASILLSNQGDLLIKMKRFDEALSVLENSKTLKEQINHSPKSIAVTKLNIALVYSEKSNIEKALAIFNDIIPLFKKDKNQTNLMYALAGRGKLFNKINKNKKAAIDCEKAYKIATQVENLEYQSTSSKCLSSSYFNLKNFKKAYYYKEKYTTFKDSIFNSKNIKKITQMQMQYDFDRQKELQEIEIKTKAKENKLIIRNLLIGLISLILLLGLLYKLYDNRKKNNLILASKNKQIKKTLADNEVLLKETHHRVKNSLQMISSLLYLQSENIEDEKAAASVKDGQIRVKSMALIHQKLYQEDNLTGVEVSDYINDLADSIFQSHNISNNDIKLQINVDKMVLDIDTITPIGIIINELIVNTLKHAFTDRNKNALIKISLHKIDDSLVLKVADNGKGFNPKDKKEKSFGLKLIKSLSRKLKADLSIINKNGTTVELKINRFTIK